ncbi:hypothetical protein UA08_05707 [Talaromyces atroroseus]|uniref:J domain-containing protein n=1 Tax=Talaromyces atroroseus TaxID=1441469 RepID=A0A225AP59_TALAT|nr:hypothetical protein UA08_05707 [Talaromyces atroroseus]OKL59078.1 hypothetical protein UA08_05707 [Talaromyces atroroseus]
MPPRLTTFLRRRPIPSVRGHLLTSSSGHSHATSSSFRISIFSTTARTYYARSSTHGPTYYEILNVPVTATAAEIKKQFYALSLKHHPDRNRSDPKATERFATISSAYQVLGDSSKRARYDLDHGITTHVQNTHSSGVSGQHPMGSHSSASAAAGSSYAGSRPASGLSKRRAAFRGPPPSFYAHGGYGTTGASRASPGATYAGAGRNGGSDEDPTSFINNNPVWHFDAKAHYKRQTAEDARREQRRSQQMRREREFIEHEVTGHGGSGSFVFRFVLVSGILIATASLVGAILRAGSSSSSSSGGLEKPTQKKNNQVLPRRKGDD